MISSQNKLPHILCETCYEDTRSRKCTVRLPLRRTPSTPAAVHATREFCIRNQTLSSFSRSRCRHRTGNAPFTDTSSLQRDIRKGGAKMPKSLGAAKPMPSHTDHFRLMGNRTEGGIPNVQFQMIMLAISKALRHFVPPFHTSARDDLTLSLS